MTMTMTTFLSKCPRCGYDLRKKWNHGASVQEILNKFDQTTIQRIRLVQRLVNKHIPSDNSRLRFRYFLDSLQGSTEDEIEWGIDRWFERQMYLQSKGYSYLKWIIFNHGIDKATKAQYEIKRHGTGPLPYLKEKGK